MAVDDKEWNQEQTRVDRVTAEIRKRIDSIEADMGVVRSDAVEIRKHFWDEVTVNFSTAEDITETYFSMKQQADVLSERERTHRHAAVSLDKLQRLQQSPYFGRIDFLDREEGITEKIYLGIASFRIPDSDTFLVYDWRAPVSSLYYDYSPGPASYETPAGAVEGEMLLKRQFVIQGGEIRFLFDTGVTIGDEMLQQVLSRTSDSQMKSIVATIQKEQNRIIRNDKSRMLVVQGAAGSGKTSAALQRVAYLLYKHRETLRSDQMVLFSPNPMFNSYVSSVLPELGEENMLQTTFQEYLESRLGGEFELEDSFTQLEYVLRGEEEAEFQARLAGIQYKSSAAYLSAINRYIGRLERDGMVFKPVKFRGKMIVSPSEINERFYAIDESVRLAGRIDLIRDWLLERLSAMEALELKEGWVEEEIELLDNEAYQRAYYKLRKRYKGKPETFDDFEEEKGLLARLVVENSLKPIRKKIRQLRFVDVRELYRQFFSGTENDSESETDDHLPEFWSQICNYTVRQLDQSKLPYEDTTPYLYLNEKIKGFRMNTSVRHVIVDEAQDYSPFQLEFLKWLFPRSKMTALGDLNQAIYAGTSAMDGIRSLVELYGEEETEIIRLSRSYRSTREIVEFSRGMVPGGGEIIPFNRNGEKPVVRKAASINELHQLIAVEIMKLLQEGYDSIAVICQNSDESVTAFNSLERTLPLRLVTKDTQSFEKGTVVIPAYLAKGVEFDAVLIYNGSEQQYGRENERKLFYTACTRAMHLLQIYFTGTASPFITGQHPDTFRFL